jgi:hypothetical protein
MDTEASSLDAEGVPDLEGPLPEKEDTGDPQEGLAPPNETPHASVDWGTTAEEQRAGEPDDLRLARDVPDTADDPNDAAQPDEVSESPDRVGEEGADFFTDDPHLGRSAEESAMHVT